MCYFLTIAVPAEFADRISEAFGRGFQLHATANPTVLSAMPSGYAFRVVTSGMCSCDLYSPTTSVETGKESDRVRQKYAKRGWSEAKIARAIQQAEKDQAKHVPTLGVRADVIERLRAICEMAGGVAMVVHWYDGEVETERLPHLLKRQCECRDLPVCCTSLREDEVLQVSVGEAEE